jgi:uridine kinase
VIILEGILVLHIEALRNQCNMNVYVDTGDHEPCVCTEMGYHRKQEGAWS